MIGRISVTVLYIGTVDVSFRSFLVFPLVVSILIGFKTQLCASAFIPVALFQAIRYYCFWMYIGNFYDYFESLIYIYK